MSSAETTPQTHVLVAEDDARTGRALTFLLQRHGYAVTSAADGRTALDIMLAQDPPAIALLDWELPKLDGLHITKAIRSSPSPRYTYVIMVTGRDTQADILTAFGAGVDDYLAKPVDTAQLVARLRCGQRVLELENRLATRVADLERTLEEVSQLKRLVPICMYCKKVRDDDNYWQEIEAYLHQRAGSDFSHGICPDCMPSVVSNEMPIDPVARRLDRAQREQEQRTRS